MLRIGKGAQVPSLDRWDTWMREAGEAPAGLKLDITTPGPLPQTRLQYDRGIGWSIIPGTPGFDDILPVLMSENDCLPLAGTTSHQ